MKDQLSGELHSLPSQPRAGLQEGYAISSHCSAARALILGPDERQTAARSIKRWHAGSNRLRILAIILRALFIGALVAVTVRVSSPQS